MGTSKTDYRPVRFLDRLEGNNHIVMLYDDDRKADMMIARYFQDGLDAGGSCIFLTGEDPKVIERKLSSQGIDMAKYSKEDKLRIFDPTKVAAAGTDILTFQKAMANESTNGMKPPFRLAGRTIPDIESIDGMQLGMNLERTGQEHFEEFGISLLCFYDIRKLECSRRSEWVVGLLENHHQVLYASDPDKAVGFETYLLEEEY
jgi:MEDS: MEthanogen/methylotroph, DcmR Sensory domain